MHRRLRIPAVVHATSTTVLRVLDVRFGSIPSLVLHLFGHGVPCSHVFSTHNNIPLELVGFLLEIGNADVCLFQDRLQSVDQLFGVPFRLFKLEIEDMG